MFMLAITVTAIVLLGPAFLSVRTQRMLSQFSRRLERLERTVDSLDGAGSTRHLGAMPTDPKSTGQRSSGPAASEDGWVASESTAAPPSPLPPRAADTSGSLTGSVPSAGAVTVGGTASGGASNGKGGDGARWGNRWDQIFAPDNRSLEERLGTQWAVWVGGIALAIGGLFLVRYSIEIGLIGPGVRLILAAVLAASLIYGGEWLRRNDVDMPVAGVPGAHIPSILTAAGTTIAFATIYAAHALYGFIGPGLAFVALGITGIAALLAAALHGPWLAGLGLLGALTTPLLVSSNSPNPWPVVLLLAVVAATAYALSRLRSWLWLANATLAGVMAWVIILLDAPSWQTILGVPAVAAHAVIQLALAAVAFAIEPHAERSDDTANPDRTAVIALAVATVAVAIAIFAPRLGAAVFVTVAAHIILLLTGWRAAPAAIAVGLAGVVSVALLLAWPGLDASIRPSLTAPAVSGVLRFPETVAQFGFWAVVLALAPFSVASARLWYGRQLPASTSALFAAGATLPALILLIVAYLRLTQFEASIPFACIAVVLAGLCAAAAAQFDTINRQQPAEGAATATGVFAAASVAAFALALVMALSRGYLTVALALAAAGTAYVAMKRNIPLLRGAVTALGLIVLARVMIDPEIFGTTIGQMPIFNWLLFGYGVPMVSFWMAARWLEHSAATPPETLTTRWRAVRISDSLAVIFAALLGFFQIRHLTHDGNIFARDVGHVEAGLMTLLALALSYALARLNAARSNTVFDKAATVFGAIALLVSALSLGIAQNPYFSVEEVTGSPLFGSLTLGYLLPGVAALFVARHLRGDRPQWYTRAAGILGVFLIFVYVTLAVRQGFQGNVIAAYKGVTEPENWSYSFAWLVLGVALLGYGLMRHSLEARMASAVLIILAAIKVTLFDLADIGGFWRALSFLSLGAVLIGIGLLYQRVIYVGAGPNTSSERGGPDEG